jgi:ATP-binding cassette subfamily B protein
MILVIGAAVSMLFIDPVLFGTAVLLLTLVLSLMLLSTKFIEKASLSSQTALGDLTSSMGRDLAGIRSIRAANATRSESEQLDKLVDRTWLTGLSVARIQAVINPLSTIGLEISAIVVLGLGIFRVSTGQLPIEGLTQFIMLLFILIPPLSQVMYAGSQIGESLAALTRIKQVERIPEETANDNTDLNIIPDTEPENKGTGDTVLEFDRVCFSYSTEGRVDMDPAVDPTTILHGLTFTVRRGSTVALVGPSGAGKSTVLQLVERFYEPESGTISVFGRDVSRCDRRELRTHLAYVEQDAPAITGTMRDNLLLGLPRTPDEKCEEVLRSVNLGHILERSGQGLDTPIGENGVALSGGERQRLAVARALLSPAEIVLLDEATANLDSRNERLITGLLTDADRSRTLIVVAHRLATVIDADVIHVMQHGRIIASGTHETLVESVPLYRDLAKEQHLI